MNPDDLKMVQLAEFVRQAAGEPDVAEFAESTLEEHCQDPHSFPLRRTVLDWYRELYAYRSICILCSVIPDELEALGVVEPWTPEPKLKPTRQKH